jgi:predicted phosphodiesterase
VRVVLEPLFLTYGVNVVFAGHDHIYERITPQKGIYYFVEGSSGQLRKGDAKRSAMNAKSFDQDMTFMLVEVAGNEMSFQTISRTGTTVDSGSIQRQFRPAR